MLKLFFKKERQLESLIYNYLENLGMIQKHFAKAMNICLKEGVSDDFSFCMDQAHKFESRADDIRDETNELMYSRVLIPESREDIMALLERVDEIPRSFEQILNMIRTQRIAFPEFLVLDIQELIRISMESCEMMAKQIEVFIKKKEGVRTLMSTIDQNESHCDHIERRIIIKLFDSNLEPFLKLQLKVHFYTLVGVPVSTSQAVIGAVLGIGLVKGISTVSRRTLVGILIGWFLTPAIACSIAVALYFIVHLRYVPG